MGLTIGDPQPDECTKVDNLPARMLSFNNESETLQQVDGNIPQRHWPIMSIGTRGKDALEDDLAENEDFLVCNHEETHDDAWGLKNYPLFVYTEPGCVQVSSSYDAFVSISWRGGEHTRQLFFNGFQTQFRDPFVVGFSTPPNDRVVHIFGTSSQGRVLCPNRTVEFPILANKGTGYREFNGIFFLVGNVSETQTDNEVVIRTIGIAEARQIVRNGGEELWSYSYTHGTGGVMSPNVSVTVQIKIEAEFTDPP